jgi:hypothetical protein
MTDAPEPEADTTSMPWSMPLNGTHAVGGLPQKDLLALLEGLQRRLASQAVIEQSKGILIGHYGIDPDTAFDMLRRWSSHTNRKLRDISEMLVTAAAWRRADDGRTNQELIRLIECFDKGQLPTSGRSAFGLAVGIPSHEIGASWSASGT